MAGTDGAHERLKAAVAAKIGAKDVRLYVGATQRVTLGNGQQITLQPFTKNGLMYLRVCDADTGAKIETIPGGVEKA